MPFIAQRICRVRRLPLRQLFAQRTAGFAHAFNLLFIRTGYHPAARNLRRQREGILSHLSGKLHCAARRLFARVHMRQTAFHMLSQQSRLSKQLDALPCARYDEQLRQVDLNIRHRRHDIRQIPLLSRHGFALHVRFSQGKRSARADSRPQQDRKHADGDDLALHSPSLHGKAVFADGQPHFTRPNPR